ncbi:LysR substrate-binding domain-containing protein [Stigmatella sp. ncwal1]|uniref:LysR substrate-binding domain-containing protein n=1 Tax=Stigmatella ashevillensis TaxID=2995309 RepID=A0ABT5D243_9BACT|nr:LysR family transcriptional regulator [Stigmatella ashevillena]MDC0707165.1 LysR substrate-binding domain-containing protein [Stigmatella ashevillena]
MDRLLSMAVFVAAIEEGSIASAARRFGISAVMAGRYLSALEEALPARLVQRTTRRLSLTDAGHAYFTTCKRVLEELEEAGSDAAEAHATPRGTLRIAAPVNFGAMYLGPLVAQYLDDFPGVSVAIHLQDRFVDLVEDGLDLAIRIGQLPDSGLVARRLASCRLIACAAPAYLERAGTPESPQELGVHARIGYIGEVSTPPWTFTASDGRSTRLSRPCRFNANNTSMMLEVTLAGFGVAYAPSFVFAQHLQRGELVQVLPSFNSPELPLHAVTPTAKHVPQKARLFIDRLAVAFGGTPPWERWQDQTRMPDRGRRSRRKPGGSNIL